MYLKVICLLSVRPLLEIYLPLYPKRYAMRHVVRPGLAIERITPSESKTWTWRDQFENDIFYIENISFWTDLKMIFAVIKAVFQGSEYRARDTRSHLMERILIIRLSGNI